MSCSSFVGRFGPLCVLVRRFLNPFFPGHVAVSLVDGSVTKKASGLKLELVRVASCARWWQGVCFCVIMMYVQAHWMAAWDAYAIAAAGLGQLSYADAMSHKCVVLEAGLSLSVVQLCCVVPCCFCSGIHDCRG